MSFSLRLLHMIARLYGFGRPFSRTRNRPAVQIGMRAQGLDRSSRFA